jgi:hypothetical protein
MRTRAWVLRDTVMGALRYWTMSDILEGSLAQAMSLLI